MTTNPRDDLDPDFNKPFVEHLDDLRKMLFNVVIIFVVCILVAIPLAPYVLILVKDTMARAGRDPEKFLKVIQIDGGFLLGLKMMFWTACVLSAPLITVCVTRFVFPGLRKKERINVSIALWATVLLFIVGAVLCYRVTLPVAVGIMLKFSAWLGVEPEWVELSNYVSFVLKLVIAFGVAFELPVIILTLGNVGIVSAEMLRTHRKHAIVGILILAMILTPPDIFTQLMMAAPMILLYECCVWAIYFKEKSRDRRE